MRRLPLVCATFLLLWLKVVYSQFPPPLRFEVNIDDKNNNSSTDDEQQDDGINFAQSHEGGLLRWHHCPSKVVSVAAKFDNMEKDGYPFREVGLTIYYDLKIPCDGLLVEWHFLSPVRTVKGLHLAVFRPSSNGKMFKLVGETYVDSVSFDSLWASYRPEVLLEVKMGDFLGVFYDGHTIDAREVTICSMTYQMDEMPYVPDNEMSSSSLLIRSKAKDALFRKNAVVALYSAEDLEEVNFIVDKIHTGLTTRYPALSALVTSYAAGLEFLQPTTLPTTPTTSTTTTSTTTTTTTTITTTPQKAQNGHVVARSKKGRIIGLKESQHLQTELTVENLDGKMSPFDGQVSARDSAGGSGGSKGIRPKFTGGTFSGANNFFSSAEVNKDSRCSGLPKTARNCFSWVKRYYYDPISSNCHQFLACNTTFRHDDAATFVTRPDCLKTCWRFRTAPPSLVSGSETTELPPPLPETTPPPTKRTTARRRRKVTTTTTTTTTITTTTTTATATLTEAPTTEDSVATMMTTPYFETGSTEEFELAPSLGPEFYQAQYGDLYSEPSSSSSSDLSPIYHRGSAIRARNAKVSNRRSQKVATVAPLFTEVVFMQQSQGEISPVEITGENNDAVPTFLLQSLPHREAFYLKHTR